MMQRGFNKTFYFVENDDTGETNFIRELMIKEWDFTFKWSKYTACALNSSNVIALEMGPENMTKWD